MGSLFSGKTLGIIGLGKIGKTLVNLTKGFNLNYLAFDKQFDEQFSKRNNIKYCDIKTLFKSSDIISIHLSLNGKTKGLISKKELHYLKNNSVLINASRGGIIIEEDLIDFTRKNRNIFFGLDVFDQEPYDGILKQFDNIILTPHVASYAREIRIAMEIESATNLINAFKKK